MSGLDPNKDANAHYVQAMGLDLGQLCQELRDDLDSLRRKWSEFKELFDKSPERIELLNVVACNFFYRVMRLSFEDAMLHLCRLTDPPKARLPKGDRRSLTVLALAEMVSDPALKVAILARTRDVREKCAFARMWRNRRLAHTDLACLREGCASTLPAVTSIKIEDALKSLGALLTLLEDHYGLPHYLLAADPWGAKALAHYLERGRQAVEDEHKRWGQQASEASR